MAQQRKVTPARGAVVETELLIADIDRTAVQEVRCELDAAAVEEYATLETEAISDPPPIDVFEGEGKYFAGDGGHRIAAKEHQGKKKILSRVTRCKTAADAMRLARLHAMGPANARHGVRRSDGDKRKTVESFLAAFPEYADASDRKVAELCHCGRWLVGDVRTKIANPDHNRPLPPKKSEQTPTSPPASVRADTTAPQSEPSDDTFPLVSPEEETPVAPQSGRAATDPDRILDARGRMVPESLIPQFKFGRAFVADLRGTLHEVLEGIKTAGDEQWGKAIPALFNTVDSDLKKVGQDVASAIPWCCCPHIDDTGSHHLGGKCRVCVDNRGWLNRHQWHQISDPVKKLIDELAVEKPAENSA